MPLWWGIEEEMKVVAAFQNKIWIFPKSEINLGRRNKNMHAMKWNLSNYSKIFLSIIRWYVLSWQVLKFSENQGVTHYDLELHQMNVNTAFLNGNLQENIYMAQLQGFATEGKEHMDCKL
jgi:hypothetical protein